MKQYIDEMRKDNPKVAEIMTNLVSEIEEDENKYKGQSILNIVENMKRDYQTLQSVWNFRDIHSWT